MIYSPFEVVHEDKVRDITNACVPFYCWRIYFYGLYQVFESCIIILISIQRISNNMKLKPLATDKY